MIATRSKLIDLLAFFNGCVGANSLCWGHLTQLYLISTHIFLLNFINGYILNITRQCSKVWTWLKINWIFSIMSATLKGCHHCKRQACNAVLPELSCLSHVCSGKDPKSCCRKYRDVERKFNILKDLATASVGSDSIITCGEAFLHNNTALLEFYLMLQRRRIFNL